VPPLTIGCVSCGRRWTASSSFSVYEQQAVESCPCPGCWAYTLCCHEEAGEETQNVLLVPARADRVLQTAGPRS
jgi:hypothetical protein